MAGIWRRPVFCLIVLGDTRGHETGKQGNRSANPGQEKLPIVRAIGSGRIDNEACDVTAGASSTATYGTARPRSPEQSRRPQARARSAQRRDLQPIPAIRHNHGSGIINSGDCLRLGMIPTRATARRLQHDRLSGGKLRHPLRQQGKYRALPFGSRAAPFADLGGGATAAGAKPCARIERADLNTWRFRRFDHAFPLNAKRLPRYPSRAIGTAAISCRADLSRTERPACARPAGTGRANT